MRVVGIFLFGILVPGLGFALPCDNFNPNAFCSFLCVKLAQRHSGLLMLRWIPYESKAQLCWGWGWRELSAK